jgi:hypothetical protein
MFQYNVDTALALFLMLSVLEVFFLSYDLVYVVMVRIT